MACPNNTRSGRCTRQAPDQEYKCARTWSWTARIGQCRQTNIRLRQLSRVVIFRGSDESVPTGGTSLPGLELSNLPLLRGRGRSKHCRKRIEGRTNRVFDDSTDGRNSRGSRARGEKWSKRQPEQICRRLSARNYSTDWS